MPETFTGHERAIGPGLALTVEAMMTRFRTLAMGILSLSCASTRQAQQSAQDLAQEAATMALGSIRLIRRTDESIAAKEEA